VLTPHLRRHRHCAGDELHAAGRQIVRVHFPVSGVISLGAVSHDGSLVEISTIGNEGLVGLPVLLGSGYAANVQAICQLSGDSFSISATSTSAWVRQLGRIPNVITAYAELQFVQAAQSVACNRLHSVEQRCARWFLVSSDCTASDELSITHGSLAHVLGVRRASVSIAASVLQQSGLIAYRRGRVKIINRRALERAACECYRVVKDAKERLLLRPADANRSRLAR